LNQRCKIVSEKGIGLEGRGREGYLLEVRWLTEEGLGSQIPSAERRVVCVLIVQYRIIILVTEF